MEIIRLSSIERDSVDSRLVPLSASRLAAAKTAYNVRRVDLKVATHLLHGELEPAAGDVLLAGVKSIGQHTRIELGTGRRASLFVGDEIVVCYGARYAPDQFEAYVPKDLSACNLVAAGGVAARFESRHARMKRPTGIEPIGLLADRHGRRLNIADWSLTTVKTLIRRPHTIAVLGTAMNAGKTTTAASLVRGYKLQGKRVGAAKVTGTGAGGDRWAVIDAGADMALDFTDAGIPSTFGVGKRKLESIFVQLINHLTVKGAEVIVLEVADGLFQEESAALIRSSTFKKMVDSVLFAAGDALGASAGVSWLREQQLSVDAVSGSLTASPLAIREAEQALGLPVVTPRELSAGAWLPAEPREMQIDLPQPKPDRSAPAEAAAPGSGLRYRELQVAGAGA